MDMSTSEASNWLNLWISGDSEEPIFSEALVSGKSPVDSPDGPSNVSSGPPRARAKARASRASDSGRWTHGICGPTSLPSSEPAGPLASWESRLMLRLARIGSTEQLLTWRVRATPSGRSISRLAPSTRRTGETESTGSQWPTPTVGDARNSRNATANRSPGSKHHAGTTLSDALWPTPKVGNDGYGNPKRMLNGKARLEDTIFLGVPSEELAQWPTPTVADVKGGRKTRSGSRNDEMLLNGLMWATPTCRDWRSGEASEATMDRNARPLNEQMVHFGPTPSCSSAPTEKRGAPNPEFACWLMGWPEEHTCGVLQAIVSYLNSRPKSSKR